MPCFNTAAVSKFSWEYALFLVCEAIPADISTLEWLLGEEHGSQKCICRKTLPCARDEKRESTNWQDSSTAGISPATDDGPDHPCSFSRAATKAKNYGAAAAAAS